MKVEGKGVLGHCKESGKKEKSETRMRIVAFVDRVPNCFSVRIWVLGWDALV